MGVFLHIRYLGLLLRTLEANEGSGAHGMTQNSRGGAYVDAVGARPRQEPRDTAMV